MFRLLCARGTGAPSTSSRAWLPSLGAVVLVTVTVLCIASAVASAAPACTTTLLGAKQECQFGEAGTGVGQFDEGLGIAVDNSGEPVADPSSGDVYVADRNSNRVDKFGADGEFLLAWGWGVANGEPKMETCGPHAAPAPSACHAGLAGGEAGELDFPAGVAVDSSTNPVDPAKGDVYVEDLDNHRVDKFTANGAFLLAWGEGVANGEEEAQTCGPEAAIHTCRAGLEVEGTGEGQGEFEHMASIATDLEGTVYVGDTARVQEFSANGAFARQVTVAGAGFIEALAVDATKNLYLMSGAGGVHEYKACSGTCVGEEVGTPRDLSAEGSGSAIALGPAGELFVSWGGRASEFEGESQVASFPYAGEAKGLAFGDGVDEAYLLSHFPTEVQVLAPPPPGPLIEAASATPEPAGKATLTATFDPEGQTENASEESHFFFEYGKSASYEASTPVEPSTGGNFESRTVPVQQIKGLEPSREYHFRVVVTNAEGKTTDGPDETFTTLPAVGIESESVSEVSATSARLQATVNPLTRPTEYHFEYLTAAEFAANGESFVGPEKPVVPQPDASAGSGASGVPESVFVEGLAPGTVYHYRVRAHNECEPSAHPGRQCVVQGAGRTFTTEGVGGSVNQSGPIDGREWEMVSPPDKHGASLEMSTEEAGLYQAAEDGGAIAYFAEAPITNDPAGARSFAYSQLLSSRESPGVWGTTDITTPQESVQGLITGRGLTEYRMFSSDLSSALVEPQGATPLCASPVRECPERTPYLRQRASGEYEPLLTPANVLPGTKFGGREVQPREPGVGGGGFEDGVEFVTATPDLGHVVLHSPLALTDEFEESFKEGPASLYEWSGGKLELVSILPNGRPAAEEGDGANLGNHNIGVRNAIGADGERVSFESEVGGENHLYLRDLSLGKTVQLDAVQAGVVEPGVDERPVFVDASANDSRVFFLDPQRLTPDSTATANFGEVSSDLYMCEVSRTLEAGEQDCSKHVKDLSVPLHAGEHAVLAGPDLGIDKTGTYVYFVASGVLAPGAAEGSPNLYVEDTVSGQTRLVAVLSAGDSPDWGVPPVPEATPIVADLTARVSADGRYVAFMSERPLTGYDNEDVSSRAPGERVDEEVFLYHAPAPEDFGSESGSHQPTLTCASCDPTGARPHGVLDPPEAGGRELALLVDRPGLWAGRWLAGSLPGWPRIELDGEALYQPRNLTNEGRLFFDSADALVPQDTNGKEDVYEYEPQGAGAGGCALAAGCVGLISSGASSEESAFIDASGMGRPGVAGRESNHEEGEDVFFMTSAKLVLKDTDNALDIYDAHVCSTIAPCPAGVATVPEACTTADSCRAAPAPEPDIFGAPASATLGGPGNLASAPPAKPKPKPLGGRALNRSKLKAALKACHEKFGAHSPKRRKACETAARKKYGAKARRKTYRAKARKSAHTNRRAK